MKKSLFARMGFAAVLAAALASQAQAGIIPVSVTVIPEAGNHRWTYSIVLPSNMKLMSGDYFTIYDFAGYQTGSASVSATGPDESYAANWDFSTAKLGPTPALLDPSDNAAIDNLTWTYNGPTIDVPGNMTLGNFNATSTFDEAGTNSFTGKNHRAAGGAVDSNITEVETPVGTDSPPDVPEPATLALAGLGLPFLGLRRILRRKTAA